MEGLPESPENERGTIDIDSIADKMRKKSIIGNDTFLIANFTDSTQEKDISEGSNCEGFGRVHHFTFNKGTDWTTDPLPHHVASWKLGKKPNNMERVQVFQNAACNCRCWYCYVDYRLLTGTKRHAAFKTADDLLNLFLKEKNRPFIIDLSGGQPDIIPEWPIRMMEALTRLGLQDRYYLWMDDNLTTYFAWKYLKKSDFDTMCSFRNFGRVGCFKGFSPESFHENTGAAPELLDRQIDIMSKWVNLGLDMYGYITLTSSTLKGRKKAINSFMDDIQTKIHPLFPLRIVPLKIYSFSPTKARINGWMKDAIQNQNEILATWKDEIENRYSKEEIECPIYSIRIN